MVPRRAKTLLRLTARLVPRHRRARWHEEWEAELASRPRTRIDTWRRALGAPRDAFTLRRLARADRHRGRWAEAMFTDLRYTVRLLARSPAYLVTVVLGLGIGLAASIGMTSVLVALFFGDPVGAQDRPSLARVRAWTTTADAPRPERVVTFSREEFDLIRRQAAPTMDIAALGPWRVTLRRDQQVGSVEGRFVSGNFFPTLRTTPAAGRLLNPDDDRADSSAVVLGYQLWQNWFQGRADALGTTLLVGDRRMQIVGVLPDRFDNGMSVVAPPERDFAQVWLPMALADSWTLGSPVGGGYAVPEAGNRWLSLSARLPPDMSRQQAEAHMAPAARALETGVTALASSQTRVDIQLYDQAFTAASADPWFVPTVIAVFMSGPLCLLMIGCANVANLRLARATARRHEWSVRLSLGATRGRLIRLLAIEAIIVSGLALGAGLVGSRALVNWFAAPLLAMPVRIDAAVVLLSLALASGVVFLSGLAPAWLATRRTAAAGLSQSTRAGGTHSKLRSSLVILQFALSVLALAIGALFARSLQATVAAAPATLEQLLTANFDLGSPGFDDARAARFMTQLSQRLDADARFATWAIAGSPVTGGPDLILGRADGSGRRLVRSNRVSPEWFDVASLRPLAGRTFGSGDAGVAVLNEAAARQLLSGEPAVGGMLSLQRSSDRSDRQLIQVVGVVPDSLRERMNVLEPEATIYLPLEEGPLMKFNVITRVDRPGELQGELLRLVGDVDPMMPWTQIAPASALIDAWSLDTRRITEAIGFLATVSLLLATAGLFAVMAYSVSLRTREIGIRMALGARVADVRRLVIRQALLLAAIGALAGLAAALPLAALIRGAFMGISPFDPLALGPVILILFGSAVAAAALPAQRAATADPAKVLRAE